MVCQPQHHWHFGPDHFLFQVATLCTVGCSGTPGLYPLDANSMPFTSPQTQWWQQSKMIPGIALRGDIVSTHLENHCSGHLVTCLELGQRGSAEGLVAPAGNSLGPEGDLHRPHFSLWGLWFPSGSLMNILHQDPFIKSCHHLLIKN